MSLIATMFTWQPVCNTTCVIKQQVNCKSYLTFSYCVINSPITITTGNIYLNYMMATLAGWGNKWIIQLCEPFIGCSLLIYDSYWIIKRSCEYKIFNLSTKTSDHLCAFTRK